MSSVRLCVVGAGRAGAVHARNVRFNSGDGDVVAVVDGDLARAHQLAAEVGGESYPTLERALADAGGVDAVVIATPTFTHRELAVEALNAGVHVFCEKPMALSAAECDEMIEAAARADRVLQIGFVRRFQPEFVEAAAQIEAGAIGDVMLVKSLTRGPGLPPAWAHDIAQSNGLLAEVNSHCFDTVRWLAGSEIVRVYAEVTNRKGEANGITADSFYDNAIVSLRFASQAIGTIDGVCPAEYGYDARVEVVGTEGLIAIGETLGTSVLTCVDRAAGGRRPVHKTWPERFSWGYVKEIQAFMASVRDNQQRGPSGEDGKRVVEAVAAANRSWQEERPVELLGAAL